MTFQDFVVGDIVEFYCEPRTARVRDVRQYMVSVELPWRTPDSNAPRPSSGKVDFPLDQEEMEMNSPWRIDPDLEDLVPGEVCIIGVPGVRAKIVSIRAFDPESDYVYTPRRAHLSWWGQYQRIGLMLRRQVSPFISTGADGISATPIR